jgi:hypothetical protein
MMKLTERQLLHAIDMEQDPETVEYLEAMYEKHYGAFGLYRISNYIATTNTNFMNEKARL